MSNVGPGLRRGREASPEVPDPAELVREVVPVVVRPRVTSVRSVVNVEKKNDAGSSGCEHAPEQAGTPSAAVTPPRMDAGATGGS